MRTINTSKSRRLSYTAWLLLLCSTLFFSFSSYELQAGDQTERERADNDARVSSLTTKTEKLSYALGLDFGSRLRREAIAIDENVFVQGFEDALSDSQPLLSEKEVRDLLIELRTELRRKKQTASLDAPPEETPDIHVSFQLDPRLTRGMYMGERWVSPQTYTRIGENQEKEVTVEVKAVVLDARGREIGGSFTWEAAEPDVVEILPKQGDSVNFTVKRPGRSSVKITSEKTTKELIVSAVAKGETLQVEITQ